MLIGIYANPERDVGLVFARKLAGELEKAGAEYVVHDSVLGVFGKARGFGDDCKPRPDMIVSLGGRRPSSGGDDDAGYIIQFLSVFRVIPMPGGIRQELVVIL